MSDKLKDEMLKPISISGNDYNYDADPIRIKINDFYKLDKANRSKVIKLAEMIDDKLASTDSKISKINPTTYLDEVKLIHGATSDPRKLIADASGIHEANGSNLAPLSTEYRVLQLANYQLNDHGYFAAGAEYIFPRINIYNLLKRERAQILFYEVRISMKYQSNQNNYNEGYQTYHSLDATNYLYFSVYLGPYASASQWFSTNYRAGLGYHTKVPGTNYPHTGPTYSRVIDKQNPLMPVAVTQVATQFEQGFNNLNMTVYLLAHVIEEGRVKNG